MTIHEIYQEYIELKAPFLTKHSLRSYNSAYYLNIFPHFGNTDIKELGYRDYQNYANKLLVSGKTKNLTKAQIRAGKPVGHKPKTVKNFLSILSGIYSYAIKCEYYNRPNFPQMVDLPAFDNKFYVDFSVEQLKAYLVAVRDDNQPIYKDMFLYLLHGKRESDVLNLRFSQLDLISGTVHYTAEENKSRKNLFFKLTPQMIEILKRYQVQAIDRENTIFPTGYVFINPETSEPYTTLYKPWKRLLKKAGLMDIKLHGLRHIIATYLFNVLDYSYEQIAVVLGHTDVSVTKTYVTVLPFYAKRINVDMFESLKSDSEIYIDNLNKNIKLGECLEYMQKNLFSSKKELSCQ